MKFALCYPTHKNCREQEELFATSSIDARCYPSRATVETEDQPVNCWNLDADAAEALGFPVVKTICPQCPHRQRCVENGYLGEVIYAAEGTVVLFTHKRAEYAVLAELTAGRQYVSIHENPLDVIRPRAEIDRADLIQLQHLFKQLLDNPFFLNRFVPPVSVDDQGEPYESQELKLRLERQYEFCFVLADLVDDLLRVVEQATDTTAWQPPMTGSSPNGMERLLFWAVRVCGLKFHGRPFRFLFAAGTGKLPSAAIFVTEVPAPKSLDTPPMIVKRVIGYRNNAPAPGATTWFNDATMTLEALQAILGLGVQDRTPRGRIACQKKAVQLPRDVTRQTSLTVVAKILRGTLTDRSRLPRVGVITHRPQLKAFNQLEPEFRERIVMATYFGSGEDRSSNQWHRDCDLIVVLGTPRVSPLEVAGLLLQIGDRAAACREPPWGTYQWEGRTESGETVFVTGRGYIDPAWRRAHQSLVRATLVQAIGRGRGILADGCEVVVVSTEECGLPLSDGSLVTVSQQTMQVLSRLRTLTEANSIYLSIGNISVSSANLAQSLGLTTRQVRNHLAVLEQQGLVVRVGERSGWRTVSAPSDDEPNAAVAVPVPTPA